MQRKAVTVKELAERYLRDHASLKEAGQRFSDERLIERVIVLSWVARGKGPVAG